MTLKRRSIFLWLMAALALAPAALYAWMGQFTRLLSEDYCYVAIGRELGAWQGMLYWLNSTSGRYALAFSKSAIAPLDVLGVRIMPALIVVLWLAALFWLVFQGLDRLGINRSRRPLALTIAALTLAAVINNYLMPRPLYWYETSINYLWPMLLLTIYLALALWLAKRTRLPIWGLAAGGLLCFITAGGAESFLVFQLIFLAFCLLACLALPHRSARRAYAPIFGVGWLATLAGSVIQLGAPGVAARAASVEARYGRPDRSLLAALFRTFDGTLEALGHPQIFAAFVLMLAVGLLVLLVARPAAAPKTPKPAALISSALWLCLVFQLLWLPLLWSHTSAAPQFFGRFSLRYMVIIGLNLAFVSGFAILLWRRRPINAYLQRHERGLLIFCNGLLLIFVILFALSQLGGIYYLPASWLFATALMFLGLLGWQLSSFAAGAETRQFGLLALCSLGMGLVCMAALVGAVSFTGAPIVSRHLSPAVYLLALSGLVWGFFLGSLVKQPASRYGQSWTTWLKLGGMATVIIITLAIMRGQAAFAGDFQGFARAWDERHLEIIAQRGSGQKNIEVPLYSPDYYVADYTGTGPRYHLKPCIENYYGVDSMVVTAD